MKTSIILLQLVMTSSLLQSQEYKIEIGSEIKLEAAKQMEDLIHVSKDGYYIYYSELRRFNNSPEITLDKYNNKFEKTFSKKLITIENDTRDHGIKYMDGKFLWLTSVYEKSDKKLDFYITPIDLMGKSGKPRMVSSLILKKNIHRPEVNWDFSPDSSKIIVFTETFLFGKNFDFLEYICVLDLDFKILNETYLDFDQKMLKADMVDFILSNDGTVFFANRSYGLNKHTSSLYKLPYLANSGNPFDVKIFRLNLGVKDPVELNILSNSQSIKSLKFAFDNENNLIISGLYGEPKTAGSVGMFYTKLENLTYNKIFSNANPLPEKFITDINRTNLKKLKNNKLGFSNIIQTKEIVVLENGQSFVIHEGEYSYDNSLGDRTYRTFYTTDKFITQYNHEGEIISHYIVPEDLLSNISEFMSSISFVNENKFYILYNDYRENVENNKAPSSDYSSRKLGTSNMVSVLAEFEDDGSISRKLIISPNDAKAVLNPKYTIQKNEKVYFLSINNAHLMFSNLKYFLGEFSLN